MRISCATIPNAKKNLKKKLHEFCHYTRVIKAAFFAVIADEKSACNMNSVCYNAITMKEVPVRHLTCE